MEKDYHLIGKYHSILYRLSQGYISAALREEDIGSGQYPFLLILYEKDGISQEELSGRLSMDKGTTARALSKLETAGYIERRNDPADRRLNRVYLTSKGREIKPRLFQTLESWSRIMLEDLNEDEKDFLLSIMERMVNSAKGHFSGSMK